MLKNMNYSFAKCTVCGRTVKMPVNAILSELKCECESMPKKIEEPVEKPKRVRKKVEADDTKLI